MKINHFTGLPSQLKNTTVTPSICSGIKHLSIRRYSKILLLCLASYFVVACGSTTTIPTDMTEEPPRYTLDTIAEAIREAELAGHRNEQLLEIIRVLIDFDEIDWARDTLAKLVPQQLESKQIIPYALLDAEMAIIDGQPFRAKGILWSRHVSNAEDQATIIQQIALHELRADLLYSVGDYRESIETRLILDEMLLEDMERRERNQDHLWQALMELPQEDLALESEMQTNDTARGWFILATLSKNNQTKLHQQLEVVENWAFNWPAHPASLRLPADLQLLKQLSQDQPRQLAILLPFSGRYADAARAIRDGILAAHYQNSSQENHPIIKLYDTSKDDIDSLYDQALSEGAELVIGPLEKERIAQLLLRPELPVPTLTLNRINAELDSTPGMFQFGLAVEDEAEQVALQAWRDGHRSAMILVENSGQGQRSAASFREHWSRLGGEIVREQSYLEQKAYSQLIKDSMHISYSNDRRKRLARLIGKTLEFEPRRRKDIDFIFLYARPSQARQLKPTLAFHYAGDLPVYATSKIYNGKVDSKMDRDLNNIRFTTLPWFFNKTLPEKHSIEQLTGNNANYQSLYALGVDAYHLHPRLKQLELIKQAQFYGSTGKLRLDEKRKIHREQAWAQFAGGKVFPLSDLPNQNAR